VKVLVVQRANLEIAHMPLVQERFLVGRSPHCDVVARAPGIGPVHFLVEWIGEGAFDPKGGVWTIYDLTTVSGSKGEDRLLEGIVLSEEETFSYGGLTIKIVDGGGLESAHDFKGGVSASLNQKTNQLGDRDLLEMVFMRRDSRVVERIAYLPRARSGKIKEHLDSDYADLKFRWTSRTLKIEKGLPDNCQLLKGAEVVKPGPDGVDSVTLKEADFWTISTPSFSVYMRYVPRIKVPKIPEQRKVEPGFWFKYWLTVIGGTLAVLSIYYMIYSEADRVPDPEPRIAQIEVVDYVPPPPVEEIPTPVEETSPVKPVSTPKEKREKTDRDRAPIPKKSEQSTAAQAVPKNEKSKAEVGLQSEAPVANVNKVGLLGAMGSAPGAGRVSADQIMNQTTTTPAADSNSGRIAIKTPPSGALGVSKPKQKVGASGKDGFTGASTSVSGDKTFNKDSKGPIARSGSKGTGFTLGSGLTGPDNSETAGSLGELSASSLTVTGGLDKETVRRVIRAHNRQIKACYDAQLMLQPNLEGRLRIQWTINPSGRVQTAQSTANTTNSNPLETCLLGVVRSMIFPKAPNGQPTQVIYPWQFTK